MATQQFDLSADQWTLIGATPCFLQLRSDSAALYVVGTDPPAGLYADAHILSTSTAREVTVGIAGQNVYARATHSRPTQIAVTSRALGAGVGALTPVPAGSVNGTPLGDAPAGKRGVRLYLPAGAAVTFTIAAAQPSGPPGATFTVSQAATGPNWDEDLAGAQMIYVTAVTGSPLFRWY